MDELSETLDDLFYFGKFVLVTSKLLRRGPADFKMSSKIFKMLIGDFDDFGDFSSYSRFLDIFEILGDLNIQFVINCVPHVGTKHLKSYCNDSYITHCAIHDTLIRLNIHIHVK